MITLEQINFSYGDTHILKNINLTIHSGEFIMLLGQSGCGKTTLLNLIGLMSKPTSGKYVFCKEEVNHLSVDAKSQIRNQKIGFVFQAFHLINHLTVVDNVALPLGYAGIKTAERRQRAIKSLEIVGLGEKCNNFPSELSGGQKQRVAIARALVINPQLIIADEPTGNLDSDTGQTIMECFKRLNQMGTTILMSTHNTDLTKYASRVIRIDDGMIKY
ncbi:ABC transporter ATP-binding protein [Tuanshanicoccus lijuaniae]|uniref:ABC transporter ATP-binding protein n=1 Tax=Aerococcaceae bacterium zg-1292 TaxID=2774330 RepID=UPI001BD8DA8E|nr:ABC transporter ATP-binding protein [Aerococcaceae bacterium zg-A91]MBS4457180.1 ABC transporter ATP-binding protein [Aerococcaceae bacterium zg-BR33]